MNKKGRRYLTNLLENRRDVKGVISPQSRDELVYSIYNTRSVAELDYESSKVLIENLGVENFDDINWFEILEFIVKYK